MSASERILSHSSLLACTEHTDDDQFELQNPPIQKSSSSPLPLLLPVILRARWWSGCENDCRLRAAPKPFSFACAHRQANHTKIVLKNKNQSQTRQCCTRRFPFTAIRLATVRLLSNAIRRCENFHRLLMFSTIENVMSKKSWSRAQTTKKGNRSEWNETDNHFNRTKWYQLMSMKMINFIQTTIRSN